MAGKLVCSLADFQKSAATYRKDLLMLPIIGLENTLQYMTGRPGIRYAENVGAIGADAQFAPYKAGRTTDANLNVDYRTLQTYFGSVVAKFEPNTAISTILGAGAASKGAGQQTAPTSLLVLSAIAKSLSEALNDAIWKGVRNESGDTSADLFDGFDTITGKEVLAGNIAEGKGNYMKLTEAITTANAVDVAKKILFLLDPRLRSQKCYLFCSQDFADKYNEAYLLSHGGVSYNNQYTQTFVEGSNGMLEIVPLYNKADSKYFHIAPKANMLVGYDQMGDMESVSVEQYEPFVLSYIATMFFGVQFESLDKRRLKVVELAE